MFASLFVLADDITIHLGNQTWTVGMNFVLYLIIAAIVGLIAEFIVGWRVPFGIVGAVIAALVGIWLMTNIIVISGVGDFFLFGVPVGRALVGAVILVAIWHLLTYGIFYSRYRRVGEV